MLLTNGLLLRKQIDEVLASVDEVIVSLDGGTAATYEAIRGVDGFDLILDGIRQVRAGGMPVTTRTTVQRANYREIPQIIEAAKAADVNSHQLSDGGCEQSVRLRQPLSRADIPLIATWAQALRSNIGRPLRR